MNPKKIYFKKRGGKRPFFFPLHPALFEKRSAANVSSGEPLKRGKFESGKNISPI